jgi:hypothetical protein
VLYLKDVAMYSDVRVGTIACWFIAIGLEYAAQKWESRKTLLNVVAAICFGLALLGEYQTYRFDQARDFTVAEAINKSGIAEEQWFDAQDGNKQTFTLRFDPLPGSLEVLINGLAEPPDVYEVSGRSVTVSAPMGKTDKVTIRYRRRNTI